MNLSYKIPESKKDITVKQYIEISKLYKQATDNETEVSEDDIISICLGIPVKYISQLPIEEYKLASDNIANALKEESVMPLTFSLNGVKCGFIPDMENITIGEYSALDNLMKDADENANKILNVLYRPITREEFYTKWYAMEKSGFKYGKKDELKIGERHYTDKRGKYLIEAYDSKRHNTDFNDASCNIYEGSLLFFYSLGNDLLNATVKYTREELEKKEAEDSGRSGDGIRPLILTLQQHEFLLMKSNTELQMKYSID